MKLPMQPNILNLLFKFNLHSEELLNGMLLQKIYATMQRKSSESTETQHKLPTVPKKMNTNS